LTSKLADEFDVLAAAELLPGMGDPPPPGSRAVFYEDSAVAERLRRADRARRDG
jgi:hypothetical protein